MVSRAQSFSWIRVLLLGVLASTLAGIAVPYFQDNLSEAQGTKARQDLEGIRKALQIRALRQPGAPLEGGLRDLEGTYLQALPLDPWGRPYQLDPSTGRVFTLGADQLPGGSGGDLDLSLSVQGLVDAPTWIQPLRSSRGLPPKLPGDPLRGEKTLAWQDVAKIPEDFLGLEAEVASFRHVEALLARGKPVRPEWVRIEDFLQAATRAMRPELESRLRGGEPLGLGPSILLDTELSPLPWEPSLSFLRLSFLVQRPGEIKVEGEALGEALPRKVPLPSKPRPWILLLDRSGSMGGPDRLDWAKQGIRIWAEALAPEDQLLFLSFADGVRREFSGSAKDLRLGLEEVLAGIRAKGGTSLAPAIERVFQEARRFGSGPQELSVLVLSDGLAGQGLGSLGNFSRLREACPVPTRWSSIGFGFGSDTHDPVVEALAQRGDGVQYRIARSSDLEAVFGSLPESQSPWVAEEAKLRVGFSKARVRRFHRLGFRSRNLSPQDFQSDPRDGGEIPPGHLVSVGYLLEEVPGQGGPLGEVELKLQDPGTKKSESFSQHLFAPPSPEAQSEIQRQLIRATALGLLLGHPDVGEGPREWLLQDLEGDSASSLREGESSGARFSGRLRAMAQAWKHQVPKTRGEDPRAFDQD